MADNFVLIKNWFNLGFPIAIPMRGIARNCAELRATVFKFRGIVQNCGKQNPRFFNILSESENRI